MIINKIEDGSIKATLNSGIITYARDYVDLDLCIGELALSLQIQKYRMSSLLI